MEKDLINAMRYIANQCQISPKDSVRDICNEAFEKYDIPLAAHWGSELRQPVVFARISNAKHDLQGK